jgi:hypothetical protein
MRIFEIVLARKKREWVKTVSFALFFFFFFFGCFCICVMCYSCVCGGFFFLTFEKHQFVGGLPLLMPHEVQHITEFVNGSKKYKVGELVNEFCIYFIRFNLILFEIYAVSKNDEEQLAPIADLVRNNILFYLFFYFSLYFIIFYFVS